MILLWLLVLLGGAAGAAAIAGRWSDAAPRWIALGATGAGFLLTLQIWLRGGATPGTGEWLRVVDWSWIPSFGIRFHLALDGLSLLLVLLTFFLGAVAVLASWREIRNNVGLFHFNLLCVLAGVAAVFMAMDLFLFYFAWELMLVPMFFLIAVWGHERRRYAAVKFFLFTQLSGLLMLIAIVALALEHRAATGVLTFDYSALLATPLRPAAALWILLGLLAAFTVKLPMFPFHTWLPDAHTEAPTAGSIVLAGLMLKTGAYGLLRFALPLFPQAARAAAPWLLALAAIGILYGGLLAFAQTDLKRLVAYTSVSHMGFVLLGVFAAAAAPAGSPAAHWALSGVVLEILCHGFSTGALFAIAGSLQERLHTREMARMSGLWAVMPRLSGAGLFFALAAVGLPGLGNFVAEFLILLGAYRVSAAVAVAGAFGILVSTFYGVELVQRVFHGPNRHGWRTPDLAPREALALAPMMAALLWLGLYPQPVVRLAGASLQQIEYSLRGGRAVDTVGQVSARRPRNSEGRPAPGKQRGAAPAGWGAPEPPAGRAQAGRAAHASRRLCSRDRKPRGVPRQSMTPPRIEAAP